MHSKLKCDTCDKNFNNPFAMIQHKAKIHDIISDGILKCDYCPALFKVQRCLEKHVKKQHGVGEGKTYTYFDSFTVRTPIVDQTLVQVQDLPLKIRLEYPSKSCQAK